MSTLSFRPHQGIIFFNDSEKALLRENLDEMVSVPIRGLFFLTILVIHELVIIYVFQVSVPIRGLFFLTLSLKPQVFTDRKMQKTAEITKTT